MNAAARAIGQNNLFNGRFLDMRLSKELSTILFLLMAVLCNSLSIVYITNTYRLHHSQLHQLEQQAQQLQFQWGQLLLERASLATPARIQLIAEEKLDMKFPISQETYLLQAQ